MFHSFDGFKTWKIVKINKQKEMLKCMHEKLNAQINT